MASWLNILLNRDGIAGYKFGTMNLHADDLNLARQMLADGGPPEAVADLEKRITTDLQLAACFAFGRDALSAALALLPPAGVIVSPIFVDRATASAFARRGLNVKWVDVETASLGPDFDALKQALSEGADAVFLPHFLGIPSNHLQDIVALCQAHNVLLIEDNRQGLGGFFENKPLGRFGDIVLLGFNCMMPVNIMQGGVVGVRDTHRVAPLRDLQRQAPPPDFSETGILQAWIAFYQDRKIPDKGILDVKRDNRYWETRYSFIESGPVTMYPAQAALALRQWSHVEQYGYYRQRHLRLWKDYASEYGWQTVQPVPQSSPAWLRAPFLIPNKDAPKIAAMPERPEISHWYADTGLPDGITEDTFPVAAHLRDQLVLFPTEM